MGAVLAQRNEHGKELQIAFASKLLNAAQRNYSISEKEGLAVVWALGKFRNLIYGYPLEIHTDHKPLTTMFKDK